MSVIDVVDLTKYLVRLKSENPPGYEADVASFLANLLEKHGFHVQLDVFGEGRQNLIARYGCETEQDSICFSGHMDTVPIGPENWDYDPFGGEIADGRIYGRGTCDMKGGIAAAVAAAINHLESIQNGKGVSFIFTGGEETGCDGAKHLLAQEGLIPSIGALVIAEPTGLEALIGHKGALWLEGKCHGVSVHGSRPHLGVNAIYSMARKISILEISDCLKAEHPELGKPTLNVGTIRGGNNINSVPSEAQVEIDIRSVPEQDHDETISILSDVLGDDIEMSKIIDLPGIWTNPENSWVKSVQGRAAEISPTYKGDLAAPYFTDASILKPGLNNVPTVVLGPGEIDVAHTVNEYCSLEQLMNAEKIYQSLIMDWCWD